MGAEYKVRMRSAAGVLVAEVTDFLEIGYTKAVNAPGLATIELPADHQVISSLENRSQVEVWRRYVDALHGIDLDWYCDFYGLYLDQERDYTDRETFTMQCPGQMWFLGTRIVAWAAGTDNRSRFTSTAAETIMKTLVDYNAGANATTVNGRIRAGTITGISCEADGAAGNSVDWFCATDNLMETLQKLATVAGGDFDLIKTAAQAWEFRWYTGQRGTDRSATVIFALERGNMALPRYRKNRISEKTVVVVGGPGQEAEREFVVRTGADYAASNDVEVFLNATNRTTTAGLQAVGDAKADETRARDEFSFEVLQTPACLYGLHYCVAGVIGDLVTAKWGDVSATEKIRGVTVTYQSGGQEKIDPQMEAQ